jgi:alpha-glucoside transport system substrate-binding protein
MHFLAEPAAGEIWAAEGGFVSPNKNVDQGAYAFDRVSLWSAAVLHGANVVRFDLSDQLPASMGSTRRSGMWQSMREFFADPTDIAGTVQGLEARAQRFDSADSGCP